VKPIFVGSKRQLLFDDFFFEEMTNVRFTMHRPTPREVVLRIDRPWERQGIHYSCTILDENRYRMWYRVDEGDLRWTCYAESRDGTHWVKPNLGLVSWHGSTRNNIAFPTEGSDGTNVCVIKDPNARDEGERYKMIVRSRDCERIDAYVSPDGFDWRFVTTVVDGGSVDSHNVLIWDDEHRKYVVYARDKPESVGRRRSVRRGESSDFRSWSQFETVLTPDDADRGDLNLYTNAATKYFRAQRAYFMFPMVLYTGRQYPGAPYPGLSDIQFATSRDGIHWQRSFRKPFISPGLDPRNWVDRNPIMGVGVVPTGPHELSMYYSELSRSPDSRLRRATIRKDGFVSIEAPYMEWGTVTTKPLVFQGRRLEMNYSTSGGGSIKVEIQDEGGKAIPGFGLEQCTETFGDKIEGRISWKGGSDLSSLSGEPIRLHIRFRDAHIYAFRFCE